jgi:hypothetical protein
MRQSFAKSFYGTNKLKTNTDRFQSENKKNDNDIMRKSNISFFKEAFQS